MSGSRSALYAAFDPNDYLDARRRGWQGIEATGRVHYAAPFVRVFVEEYAIIEDVQRVETARLVAGAAA